MLSKNVDGSDNHKANVLKELENESLKVTDRLNSELIEARTEIIGNHDKYYGDLRTKLFHLNALSARSEASLKYSIVFEGEIWMWVCLWSFKNYFMKTLTCRPNYRTFYNDLTKKKIAFKFNKRFQPLMQNSKLGWVSVTTTSRNIEPLPKLNFPFELPKPYDMCNSNGLSKQRRDSTKTASKGNASGISTSETFTADSIVETIGHIKGQAVVRSQTYGPERRNKRQNEIAFQKTVKKSSISA